MLQLNITLTLTYFQFKAFSDLPVKQFSLLRVPVTAE